MENNIFPPHSNEDEDVAPKPKKSFLKRAALGVFDFLKTVVIIFVLAFVIKAFVIQPYIIDGESMEPTFQNNDYLITEKVSYHLRQPQRGDIVIFHPPDSLSISYVKRIVGLPEDEVEIKDKKVYVNGKRIIEPYLTSNDETAAPKGNDLKMNVSANEYFVMGDNRNHSRDSREIGPIPSKNIVSRIWFRLLPVNNIKAFAHVNYETSPGN